MIANERNASASLKAISCAEADFRANDRDKNGIQDFWTGDVTGLWRHGVLGDKLVAWADAAPIKPLVPQPSGKLGYHFVAMDADDSQQPAAPYREDTDRKTGKVHNLTRFGFCAYPEVYGKTGRWTYFVNESNTVYKIDNGGKPVVRWPEIKPADTYSRIE